MPSAGSARGMWRGWQKIAQYAASPLCGRAECWVGIEMSPFRPAGGVRAGRKAEAHIRNVGRRVAHICLPLANVRLCHPPIRRCSCSKPLRFLYPRSTIHYPLALSHCPVLSVLAAPNLGRVNHYCEARDLCPLPSPRFVRGANRSLTSPKTGRIWRCVSTKVFMYSICCMTRRPIVCIESNTRRQPQSPLTPTPTNGYL